MSDELQNPLDVSDEDFLRTSQPPPPDENQADKPVDENVDKDADKGTDKDAEEEQSSEEDIEEADESDKKSEDEADKKDEEKNVDDESDDKLKKPVDKKETVKETDKKDESDKSEKPDKSDKDTSPGSKDEKSEKQEEKQEEPKVFQVPVSFKANGKTIELKSEAEAVALMQMGANYTRKLQELQPHRKMLMMLQNNDLLDEGKLTYLIDLDKKNPEAIKKLIKESGIDPLEIDTNSEPAYKPGDHTVSDEEAQFRTVVSEIATDAAGKSTVLEIQTKWDQTSKDAVWKQPEIMRVIHEQRENGIYEVISTEVDRRRTLGTIASTTPFLEAYKTVGDEMAQAALAGAKDTDKKAEQSQETEKVVVATRKADPKSTVKDSDKAAAAAPSRSGGGTGKETKNPLAVSDEEFLKSMEGRL